MEIPPSLQMDPNFEDFNFSAISDPGLVPGDGPTRTSLYQRAYEARSGDRAAASAFADAMCWTLRKGSFEAFKWKYGPRPIEYRDWFYAKLTQFFEILLYEELLVDHTHRPKTDKPWEEGYVLAGTAPLVQAEDLENAFSPADLEKVDWHEWVLEVSQSGKARFKVFQRLLQERIAARPPDSGGTREAGAERMGPRRYRRSKQDERNTTIAYCRQRRLPPEDICKMLDAKGFETTPNMRKHGLTRWLDALNDPDFRNNVEQVISKATRRFRDVKP